MFFRHVTTNYKTMVEKYGSQELRIDDYPLRAIGDFINGEDILKHLIQLNQDKVLQLNLITSELDGYYSISVVGSTDSINNAISFLKASFPHNPGVEKLQITPNTIISPISNLGIMISDGNLMNANQYSNGKDILQFLSEYQINNNIQFGLMVSESHGYYKIVVTANINMAVELLSKHYKNNPGIDSIASLITNHHSRKSY